MEELAASLEAAEACGYSTKIRHHRAMLTMLGYDLAGNTFWEFKDALNANRMRRIVKYTRKTHHADVVITREPSRIYDNVNRPTDNPSTMASMAEAHKS